MKKLLLVLVALLLFGGVLSGIFYNRPQKTDRTSPQPNSAYPASAISSDSDKTAVSEVAANFYKNYDSCMKNPPAQAVGKVSEYCQNNTGLTASVFADNLEKGGTAQAGADPIFCAQNPPESVTINPDIQITDGGAVVLVGEKFGPTQFKVQVDLSKETGDWKIVNITCPLP